MSADKRRFFIYYPLFSDKGRGVVYFRRALGINRHGSRVNGKSAVNEADRVVVGYVFLSV